MRTLIVLISATCLLSGCSQDRPVDTVAGDKSVPVPSNRPASASSIQPVPGQPAAKGDRVILPEEKKHVTYGGEWTGEQSDGPRVKAILIEKDVFPCNGEVRFHHK